MVTNPNSKAGYTLYRASADVWHLEADYGTFPGDLKKVLFYAVNQLGFDFGELEKGIDSMFKNDHNVADFGIMKKFMYSSNRDDKNENRNYH